MDSKSPELGTEGCGGVSGVKRVLCNSGPRVGLGSEGLDGWGERWDVG